MRTTKPRNVMVVKEHRRPVIDPLLLALKSRRVLIAICTLTIGLIVLAVPEMAPLRDELLVLLISLALGVIGGYSLEDAVRAGRERVVEPTPDDLKGLLRVVLLELYDEMTSIGREADEKTPDGTAET